jgi:uncharacterized glyoxalase superfamily protein PhnB
MVINRTTGSASVVPELVYDDVEQAISWLCAAFGFTELWRAGGQTPWSGAACTGRAPDNRR